jgi:hypothetical protein
LWSEKMIPDPGAGCNHSRCLALTSAAPQTDAERKRHGSGCTGAKPAFWPE